MDWLALAERFGIPLVGLVLFSVAIYRGWLRSGPQVDAATKAATDSVATALALAEKEIEYREVLRAEERSRADRLEQTLVTTVATLRDMTEVLKDVERELVRNDGRARA